MAFMGDLEGSECCLILSQNSGSPLCHRYRVRRSRGMVTTESTNFAGAGVGF
ncbi:predicted protein [Arabidopsis lyrata subsp. lyrata]|uniref:Predicted protein n=1 Tax=Arabidopsis lyrata subsp. lyrata TaxID=81972 RepID=D7LNM9_ARALL|nr:predicted protein [Arabidopsis lyrata subsp. lyrata]